MDIDMPILNGLEATEMILRYFIKRKGQKPIIIASTAYVD